MRRTTWLASEKVFMRGLPRGVLAAGAALLLTGVCWAESSATAPLFRLETRESFGGRLACGQTVLSATADGVHTGSVAGAGFTVWGGGAGSPVWDTAQRTDGWYALTLTSATNTLSVSLAVLNGAGVAVREGTLAGSATWSSNAVQVVRHWVVVPNGVTLTLGPGTVVKFTDNTGIQVSTGGVLNVRGAVLTHVADDTVGGDTNMDGAQTQPTNGEWIACGGAPTLARVGFDAQGGAAEPDRVFTAGESYGWLPVPARAGYVFGGWFTAAGGAGTQITAASSVTSSPTITLFAKWFAPEATDYEYTITNGTVTVTGYKGLGGNITVPASIEGFPVTVIGMFAFWQCSSLTTVTVPNSVTNIEISVFYGCTNLTSVAISDSVTNIGAAAFGECYSLTNIIVSSSNPAYSSVDGVLFDKARTCLVSYPAGKPDPYIIPYGTVNIGEEAFSECYRLTGVTIPDSVTMIGSVAFFGCSSLATVTIPDSVTVIGESPFAGCDSLTNIAVSCSNPAYSSVDGVLFDKARTSLIQYPGGKTGAYQIPSGTVGIGYGAFYECPYLTDVTIPESVTDIGYAAFGECPSLESVMIGNGMASIGEYAFAGCGELAAVYFKGDAPESYEVEMFDDSDPTVYYVAGTAGWETAFGGLATAVWTSTAAFDADGGAASFAGRTYNVGLAYGELPTASRPEGVFRGWRTAAGGGGATVTTNTPVPYVTAGHALYAEWSPFAPVISPTNGMVFNAAAQKVTITCATAGAEIRYTTNGVDPTVESALYSKAFNIYATTTVKAKAFMSGMTPSDLAAAVISKYVSLAEALNIPALTVTTDGLTPWIVQTMATHDGLSAARSGAIGNGGATWMQTTVSGVGPVSFWWKASCEDDDYADDWDYLVFLVDGTEKRRLDGITGWQQVTVALSAGEHTLRWEYRKDSDGQDGEDCGWVDQVVWTPAGGSTTTTEVPVPYAWLDTYGLVTGGDYEAAADLDADGDGHTAWQEYVAGSLPTNKDSVLHAYLSLTNGAPVLQWTPDLGTARLYTVEGKASLTNAAWTAPTNAATRFFRVKVSFK